MRGALSPPRFSLHGHLALVVTAALLPMALLAVWLTVTIARDQRAAQRGRMQDTARALAVAIDHELLDDVHTLQAVAASTRLDDDASRDTLRAELRRVAAAQRDWRAIRLYTPDGACVLDTDGSLEAATPPEPDRVRDVLDRGTPVISREAGLAPSTFAVRVPVMRDGSPRYVLSASVSTRAMADLFGRESLPAAWRGSLVDGRGEIFARSPEPLAAGDPRPFPLPRGGLASPGGRSARPDGPVHGVYARSRLTDWRVVLAAPAAGLGGPWRRAPATLAGAGLAVLLLSILLAALAVRPIAASLTRDLAAAARGREIAERTGRESLAQLSAVVNQATAGIAQVDGTGRFLLVNPRYGELVGRGSGELIGHSLEEVLHPDDRAHAMAVLGELTPEAPERVTESRYRAPDGSSRWVDASLSLVRGAITPGMVTIVALDATGRRTTLDAARAGDARFRTLADAAPVLVWLAAPDARRTWFNSQWLAFVGRRLDEETGVGWLQHVHPDDRARCVETAERDFAARRRCRLEYRLRRHDGIDRWMHDDGVPLGGADGAFSGYVGACVDITGQKLAELERTELLARERAARREAEAASQAKDEFLAALSHELRTPLHALRLWAGVLRSGLGDPQALTRAADTIDRNAILQARLVDDLLDVSRIVSGKLQLVLERVDLRAIVEAAAETARAAALNKGVALIQDLDPGAAAVQGDATRLQQVVWNLLANAVRFTPAGGRVEIRLRRTDGAAVLTVIDSGRGIAAELLPHVFDRFRQGESGTTRSHGGLGLGLSIARQLVELHGGTIEAASPGEGGGATFTVRLPVVDAVAAPGPAATPAEARPPRPLEGVHVLVVDDDAETREVMAVALGLQGALVTTAPSVAEAIAAVERDWPDVLLSDIGMPGEDGYDLIRKVRDLEAVRGRHIATIALTASAAADDRRRVLEAGYEAHLAKPVPAATVAPLIAGLLGPGARFHSDRQGGISS